MLVCLPIDLEDGGGFERGSVTFEDGENFIVLTYNSASRSDVLNGLAVSIPGSDSSEPTQLVKGQDNTVTFSYNSSYAISLGGYDMTAAGVYVVYIRGLENYSSTKTALVVLIKPKDINEVSAEISETTYTASPQTATVTVTDRGITVTDMIVVVTYTVHVALQGGYSGSFDLTYTIRNTPSGGGGTIHYTIEVDAGRGGISPHGAIRVDRGDDQAFRITVSECYAIADVTVDSRSVDAVIRYTFEDIRKNHTIKVSFRQLE